MSDQSELDEILSDAPLSEEASATETPPERDEHGRFAAKAMTEPEKPEAETQPEAEAQPEPEAEQTGTVPQKALHEARQRERAERERADNLERHLQQLTGQVQALMQQRQPQTPQQQKAPDFWENPNEFVRNQMTPVQQQLASQREAFSRMMAEEKYGPETVQQAYQALGMAMQSSPSAQADYERIMQSQHPYGDLVAWHKRQQTLQRVGEDPDAWLEAELEKRLSDPGQQAKILERLRGAASGNVNPSQPATQLPPSLNRIPGGNAAGSADLSDAALFSQALG